jgi:pilus assembly protein CpaF
MSSPELASLMAVIADERLNELMVNSYDSAFGEREGKLEQVASPFASEEAFEQALASLEKLRGTVKTGAFQWDGMLPGGSRFHVTLPPQSPDGPTLSIRKFVRTYRGLENLVTAGALSAKAARFLEACVKARLNILISGTTSSGKTSLLNALCDKVSKQERIITVEDVPEIQLDHPNRVRMVSVHGERGSSLRDCVTGCLRMRPDRIVIGECRSLEALEMLQSMNTGHDGGMATIHANSAADALSRLESLILIHSGIEIPVTTLRRQIVAAIDMIIHLRKVGEGRRQIEEILELESMEGEIITRQAIFKRGINDDAKLACCGLVPTFAKYFEGENALPRNFFDPLAFEK